MNVVARSGRRPAFLESAKRIGALLCRDAIWDGDACNWIGHTEGDAVDAPSISRKVSALSPEVYGGTAGVALFLAQLHRVTREPRHRDTAAGAIRQALARAAEAPADLAPLGLYNGRLGIAWVAVRLASWLDEADLGARGLALAHELLAGPRAEPLLDLASGIAGAVIALLALGRSHAAFAGAARRFGDELVESARRDGAAWSWDPVRTAGPGLGKRMLTGMSHGAAGIGLALAELWAETREARYRDAAVGAFAYEDQWFDAERQSWRDLRVLERPGRPTSDEVPPTFAMAWCHGAPGSGLARLRASTLIAEMAATWRPTIDAAAATAASWLARHARDRALDVTPCHGLAGVTEFLSAASREHDDLVTRVWRNALAAHERAESWPSGVSTRARNPSLMVGLAGVGHAFLRLHDPVTESLLVP